MRLRIAFLLIATASVCVAAMFAAPQTPTAAGAAQRASGTITVIGSIVDVNLVPVPGARVALERTGEVAMNATTGTDGQFRFEHVAAGPHRVRVSHNGFVELVRDVAVPSGAATVRLPLVLLRPSDRIGGSGQNNI